MALVFIHFYLTLEFTFMYFLFRFFHYFFMCILKLKMNALKLLMSYFLNMKQVYKFKITLIVTYNYDLYLEIGSYLNRSDVVNILSLFGDFSL